MSKLSRRAFLGQVFGAKGVEGILESKDESSACFVTPDRLIYCGNFLSPSQKCLWQCLNLLCQRRNPNSQVCWPSRETLALMMGMSERQVARIIEQLVKKDVLRIRQRADGTAYYLLLAIPESYMNRTKERLPKPERVELFHKRVKPILARTSENPICFSEMIGTQEPPKK